ncbi:MAG: hypothetical protein DSM106950_01500 [Stigonema ocellatum SAG 48.90 = DSM 106950]|nr:hypothetical protein [Stigonema ocellatum SAG 48.90 = DSM 106950]
MGVSLHARAIALHNEESRSLQLAHNFSEPTSSFFTQPGIHRLFKFPCPTFSYDGVRKSEAPWDSDASVPLPLHRKKEEAGAIACLHPVESSKTTRTSVVAIALKVKLLLIAHSKQHVHESDRAHAKSAC